MKLLKELQLTFNDINKRDLTKFDKTSFYKFAKITVWLLAPNDKQLKPSFNKLALRIDRLWTLSGSTHTVSYLKEGLRLCQKTLAGEATIVSSEIRIAVRRGFPLIIPGDLRLLMEAKDPRVVKVVLTLLSTFRLIESVPKLKLETITGPFTGLAKTLPEVSLVMNELISKFLGNKELSYFRPIKGPFIRNRNLLNLTTAGPNQRSQILAGYPSDALAFMANRKMMDTYESFAKKTNCILLFDKLKAEIKFWQHNILRVIPNSKEGLTYGELCGLNKDLLNTGHLKLGKLSLKFEAAGKVRVFAIVDA